jgi:hypothetical protein
MRGEIVHICADPECEIHGRPNFRAEQEAVERQRQKEWKRQQEQRQTHREHNRRLLDAVLERIPKTLTRADYELLVGNRATAGPNAHRTGAAASWVFR